MSKKLNLKLVNDQMINLGLSQSSVAKKCNVTRATVSDWLKPVDFKFPRPKHLLSLSRVLEIPFNELVLNKFIESKPSVAFRKSGNYKITSEEKDRFFFIANQLEKLTRYLPYDSLSNPPTLKSPKNEYEYIQSVAAQVKNSINNIGNILEVENLVSLFNSLQAVIVPVFWGSKAKNTPHIFIYLIAAQLGFLLIWMPRYMILSFGYHMN